MSTPESVRVHFFNNPEIQGTFGRSCVCQLCKTPGKALLRARRIEHPWYRCQAIASIVEANPDHPQALAMLEESLAAAYSQSEPNRVAIVSWWPLRQLVNINLQQAFIHVQELLVIIAREPHGLRRLCGLRFILNSVASNTELRNAVLIPFLDTARISFGWRSDKLVASAALQLAAFDHAATDILLQSRPNNRFSKRCRNKLLQQS